MDVNNTSIFEGLVPFMYLGAILGFLVLLSCSYGSRVLHKTKQVIISRWHNVCIQELLECCFFETVIMDLWLPTFVLVKI